MTTESNQKLTLNARTGKPKKSSRGGVRKGAGRPRGSVAKVTISGLLDTIELRGGRSYMDLLTEDFLDARGSDRGLAAKYHNLILNKVMATMSSVEVTSPQDELDAKTAAFAEALAQISQIASKTTKD
jgi:hypothetical protein